MNILEPLFPIAKADRLQFDPVMITGAYAVWCTPSGWGIFRTPFRQAYEAFHQAMTPENNLALPFILGTEVCNWYMNNRSLHAIFSHTRIWNFCLGYIVPNWNTTIFEVHVSWQCWQYAGTQCLVECDQADMPWCKLRPMICSCVCLN